MAVEYAHDIGMIMLQLPEYTIHRLQPLDVTVFQPLNVLEPSARQMVCQNIDKTVLKFQILELLNEGCN